MRLIDAFHRLERTAIATAALAAICIVPAAVLVAAALIERRRAGWR